MYVYICIYMYVPRGEDGRGGVFILFSPRVQLACEGIIFQNTEPVPLSGYEKEL